jgi:hypothetical protein
VKAYLVRIYLFGCLIRYENGFLKLRADLVVNTHINLLQLLALDFHKLEVRFASTLYSKKHDK